MRALKFIAVWAVLVQPVAWLGGCASQAMTPTSAAVGQHDASPQRSELRADLPIPPGASFDAASSFLMGPSERWVGRVVLNVEGAPTQAFNFYQREMAALGWDPLTSVQAKVSLLAFARGERVAAVQIEDNTFRGSRVTVTVSPREAAKLGQAAKPRQ